MFMTKNINVNHIGNPISIAMQLQPNNRLNSILRNHDSQIFDCQSKQWLRGIAFFNYDFKRLHYC